MVNTTAPPPEQVHPLPEGAKVYIGDEVKKLEEDESNKKKIQLPPNPEPIIEWNEDEEKNLMYTNQDVYPMSDIQKRLQYKMFNVWNFWGTLRNNERLIKAVNEIPEDKDSDEFFIRQSLVVIVDRLAKILNGGTNIVEEILTGTPEPKSSDELREEQLSLKQREQLGLDGTHMA